MELPFKLRKKNIPGFSFVLSLFVGLGFATQVFAKYTGYSSGLGSYLFNFKGYRIYFPLKIVEWLYKYSKAAPRAADKATQVIFISTIVSFFFVMILKKKKPMDSHGSATWASEEDMEEAELYLKSKDVEKTLKNSNMFEHYSNRLSKDELYRDGVVLGKNSKGKEIIHNGVEHIMLMAPTRSGKGVGVIIPTLLTWKHSTVVNDIKGENYHLTKKYRETLGHRVLKFDPTDPFNSCKYNPLKEINKGTSYEFQEVRMIAEIICEPKKGDHWSGAAQDLLMGIIFHVIYASDNPTLSGVIKFLTKTGTTIDEKMIEIMEFEHTKDNELFKRIYNGDVVQQKFEVNEEIFLENNPRIHPKAARFASDILEKADNEKTGVVSTLKAKMGLYQDPIVEKNTSGSDFRIADLMTSSVPLDLFLVTPPKAIKVMNPLLRIMLVQIFDNLIDPDKFEDGTKKSDFNHRLLLLIDELPALGLIDKLQQAIAYMAGYGIKGLFICQDLKQLTKIYGKDNSILSNCFVNIFYTPSGADEETPKLISNSLGDKTIEYTTKSYKGLKYMSDWNYSTHLASRRLLTEAEVKTYSKDKNIIFVNNTNPIQGYKIRYYEDKRYLKRLNLDHKKN